MDGNKERIMIFFTSDTHFNHKAIISYCSRPFESVEEMNDRLIDNWNQVVKPSDTVYHLGDFALYCNDIEQIRKKLNGKINLIQGNHSMLMELSSVKESNRNYDRKNFSLFPLNSVDTQIISINICNTNAIIKANTPSKMDNSLKETSRTTLTNNVRKDSINGTAILINTCFL